MLFRRKIFFFFFFSREEILAVVAEGDLSWETVERHAVQGSFSEDTYVMVCAVGAAPAAAAISVCSSGRWCVWSGAKSL